jgi:hypothetical protein
MLEHYLLSPAGFTSPVIRRVMEVVGSCECGAQATRQTFTGPPVCAQCRERRAIAASLLEAIVLGHTPEEILDGSVPGPLRIDPASDALQRQEMLDHVDLLMAACVGELR